MIGEYESYSVIQKHMKISEALYRIDAYGKHILKEIREKKNIKLTRRSYAFHEDIDTIYNNINDTINVWRFKSRLYLTLQYYLDEALFHSINENDDHFFIEDDKYELTQLYFGQEQWIRDPMIQTFGFHDEKTMNIDEAMIIRCYLKEYNDILILIDDIIKGNNEDTHFKRKLISVVNKIRKKHENAIKIIDQIVVADITELHDTS